MTKPRQWFYLTNAYKAENKALELYPGTQLNTKADAFRHAYFHAMNTINLGRSLSTQLGDAHEDMQGSEPLEVQMDLFNNEVGRTIAEKARASGNDYDLANLVRTALYNGELKYLSPLDLNGTIIPNITKLIRTNQ